MRRAALTLTSFAAICGLALSLVSCEHAPLTGPQGRPEISASVTEQQPIATAYSGEATAVRATVAGITTTLSHAGPLPSGGGADDAVLLGASVPGVLGAALLHSATVGAGSRAVSEASAANLQINVGILRLGAVFVKASASSKCSSSGVDVSGSSKILGLVINGKAIVVTGRPNQTVYVPLGLGRVVINEVIESDDEVTVNALHVYVLGLANIVVAQAEAGVTCEQAPHVCTDDNFAIGDGSITGTPSGSSADFALAVGIDGGSFFFGHLVFNDNAPNGPRVVATSITKFLTIDPTTRRIQGTATVNGVEGFTFTVEVKDGGPSGMPDTFSITLSDGYEASGSIAGGGIEVVFDLCPVDS